MPTPRVDKLFTISDDIRTVREPRSGLERVSHCKLIAGNQPDLVTLWQRVAGIAGGNVKYAALLGTRSGSRHAYLQTYPLRLPRMHVPWSSPGGELTGSSAAEQTLHGLNQASDTIQTAFGMQVLDRAALVETVFRATY